jgi:hypothetical protein
MKEIKPIWKLNEAITPSAEHIYLAVADSGKDIYWLYLDKEGWIFRSIRNGGFGHTGFYKTPEEAVTQALEMVADTQIFHFDSILEAAKFIVSKNCEHHRS